MPNNQDQLLPDELLGIDQYLLSLNGLFTLVYQSDGNLVLYKNYMANNCGTRDSRALWASNTYGRPAQVCIMQGDGNLVIYGPDGEYIWDTATDGQPGSRLVMQDDGNAVIYRSDGAPIWATNTVQQPVLTGTVAQGDDMQPNEVLNPSQSITSLNGLYTFVYQCDGNLVLYRNTDRAALWASNTYGRPAQVCIMQGDGNLVIYGPDGEYIWDTATNGQPGSRLVVQDDGNVVIYNANNRLIWSTDTAPPIVSNFTPMSAQRGDTITIEGNNFVRVQRVLFANVSARYSTNSRTRINAVVPDNANSGSITVNTPVGTAVSSNLFTVIPTPQPIINSFLPIKGRVGTDITITGSNFSRVTVVQFNGVTANFRIESDAIITATVPTNASNGPITVTNRGGSATSGNSFDVEYPANLAFINTGMNPTEWPSVGQAFTVWFSFYNGGGVPTGNFSIKLQLDNGAAYQTISAPSYAPGTGDVVSWYFPNGLPIAGSHWFYAYLDVNNQVAEINEFDNISYHGFSVGF
jgi:hypothetical protein